MASIFRLLASAVSLYTFLCFLRVLITWIPSIAYSPFGRFLATLCDPFLNIFRNLSFLRFSMIDFTPIVAFSVLFLLSTVFSSLGSGRTVTVGVILSLLFTMVWDVASSVLTIFIVFLVIRLIVLLIGQDSNRYGSIWNQIDSNINPIVFRMTAIFSGKRPMSYKMALILAILMLLFVQFCGRYVISILSNLAASLPF